MLALFFFPFFCCLRCLVFADFFILFFPSLYLVLFCIFCLIISTLIRECLLIFVLLTLAYLSLYLLSKGHLSRLALMVIYRWPALINL